MIYTNNNNVEKKKKLKVLVWKSMPENSEDVTFHNENFFFLKLNKKRWMIQRKEMGETQKDMEDLTYHGSSKGHLENKI